MQEQFAKPIPQLKHVLRMVLQHQFVNEKNEVTYENPTSWILKLEGKLLSNNIEVILFYKYYQYNNNYNNKYFINFFKYQFNG